MDPISDGPSDFKVIQDILQSVPSDSDRRERFQKLLWSSAKTGKYEIIDALFEDSQASKYIDIDAKDDDGSSALIYATSLQHHQAFKSLLENGADCETQDRKEWTPLIWAVIKNEADMVKTLLSYGASKSYTTATGKNALSYSTALTSPDILTLLRDVEFEHPTPSIESSTKQNLDSEELSDYWYSATDSMFAARLAEEESMKRMMADTMISEAPKLEVDMASLADTEDSFYKNTDVSSEPFVFDYNDIPVMIRLFQQNKEMYSLKAPLSLRYCPANVSFLCLKYANQSDHTALIVAFSEQFFNSIEEILNNKRDDMVVLTLWLSNLLLLLYYLRRDGDILLKNKFLARRIEDLISDAYTTVLFDSERRLYKELSASVIDYEEYVPPMSSNCDVNGDRPYVSCVPEKQAIPTPKRITSLMSSFLYVLQASDIHGLIITQFFGQIYYWMSSYIFNTLLELKYCHNRHKALSISLNVSVLEEWASKNEYHVPTELKSLENSLKIPTMAERASESLLCVKELLQLIQCLTQISDSFDSFLNALKVFKTLGVPHAIEIMKKYSYEPGEKKISSSVLSKAKKYVKDSKAKKGNEQSNEATTTTANPLHYNVEKFFNLELPSLVDMTYLYAGGLGGVVRDKKVKIFTPTVNSDFLDHLDQERND